MNKRNKTLTLLFSIVAAIAIIGCSTTTSDDDSGSGAVTAPTFSLAAIDPGAKTSVTINIAGVDSATLADGVVVGDLKTGGAKPIVLKKAVNEAGKATATAITTTSVNFSGTTKTLVLDIASTTFAQDEYVIVEIPAGIVGGLSGTSLAPANAAATLNVTVTDVAPTFSLAAISAGTISSIVVNITATKTLTLVANVNQANLVSGQENGISATRTPNPLTPATFDVLAVTAVVFNATAKTLTLTIPSTAVTAGQVISVQLPANIVQSGTAKNIAANGTTAPNMAPIVVVGAAVADTTAPTGVSISPLGNSKTLKVVFSEAVEVVTAVAANTWIVTTGTAGAVNTGNTVTGVAKDATDATGKTILVTVTTKFAFAAGNLAKIVVPIGAVRDLAATPNTLAAAFTSSETAIVQDTAKPTVASVSGTAGQTKIVVVFNEDVTVANFVAANWVVTTGVAGTVTTPNTTTNAALTTGSTNSVDVTLTNALPANTNKFKIVIAASAVSDTASTPNTLATYDSGEQAIK